MDGTGAAVAERQDPPGKRNQVDLDSEVNLNLWQMFIERLQANLVLVLEGFVQLPVPVSSPAPQVCESRLLHLGKEFQSFIKQ